MLEKEIKWKELKAEEFPKQLSPKFVQLYEHIQSTNNELDILTKSDITSLIGIGSSFEHYIREHKLQLEND